MVPSDCFCLRANPTALIPVFAKYCSRAIAIMADKKSDQVSALKAVTSPKNSSTTSAVNQVEHAIIAELKSNVSGRLLILRAEIRPSVAASTIAGSGPYSSNIRNMKLSARVTLAFTRGMRTEMRELTKDQQTS